MTPSEVVAAIGRQWKLVLAVATLTAVIGAVLAGSRDRTYETNAKLILSVQTSRADASEAYDGIVLAQLKARSYVSLVADRTVAAAVVQRLRLDTPVEDLQARLSAVWLPDTNLITVTVVDSSPQTARRIADAMAPAFAERVAQLEGGTPTGLPPTTVELVEPAALPTEPTSPGPVGAGVMGALLGLVLGSALAVVRTTVDPRAHTVAEPAAWLGVPALGTVEQSRSARRRPLDVPISGSSFGEGLRTVRAHLALAGGRRMPVSLAIVSAGPGEGRTTMACCLAQVLTEGGSRVLLVEADFRRPSALQYLEAPPLEPQERGCGLSDVLLGAAQLIDAIERRGPLDVLGAGRAEITAADAFGRRDFSDLAHELALRYDHVVYDTPPLVVSDALLLAGLVDAFILVARWGRSRRSSLEDGYRALIDAGGSVAGVVLNGRPGRSRQAAVISVRRPVRQAEGGAEVTRQDPVQLSPVPRHDLQRALRDRAVDLDGTGARPDLPGAHLRGSRGWSDARRG